MSHRKLPKYLLWLLLILLVLSFAQTAFSESEEGMHTAGLKLLNHGDFPEGSSTLAVMPRSDFSTYVLGQLKNLATEIDVSSYRIPDSDIYSLYEDLLNSHPELFYMESTLFWDCSGDYVSTIKPSYQSPVSEIPSRVAAFNQSVDKVVKYAGKASTIEGKLVLINDYLCANFAYDVNLNIMSVDQFFAQGKGVCQAYALAYKVVLDRLGIPNTIATSTPMSHVWNVVLVNGNWYHVDVTWNDPESDVPYRAYHDYLLLSDAAITALNHHSWETSVTCTSTAYDDYLWRSIDSSIPVIGNTMYYTHQKSGTTFAFSSYNFSTGASEELFTYQVSRVINPDLEPPVWVTSSHYYYCTFDKVYSRSRSTGEETLLYTLTSGSPFPYITFMAPKGNDLYFVDFFTHQQYSIPLAVPEYQLSLPVSQLQLSEGDTTGLTPIIAPEPEGEVPVVWGSSNQEVAVVDATGTITAVAPGYAVISAALNGKTPVECLVIVHDNQPLALPADTLIIKEEGFAGIDAQEIILPEGLLEINSRVFADNASLRLVYLPDNLTLIAQDAFENSDHVVLLCNKGSNAESVCEEGAWPYLSIEE